MITNITIITITMIKPNLNKTNRQKNTKKENMNDMITKEIKFKDKFKMRILN